MEKVIRVFDSFYEADESDAISRSRMTPGQRVDIFFEIRARAMPLSSDLKEFIGCLNSNRVDHLVVGALAVSWPDSRYSGDIDFLIRPTAGNVRRVRAALVQFGFGELDISLADLTAPGKVIQSGYEPNRIDLMTSITGVGFEEAWDTRVTGEVDGLSVSFIGKAALLRNKDATGRSKDKIDADQLRRQAPRNQALLPWQKRIGGGTSSALLRQRLVSSRRPG